MRKLIVLSAVLSWGLVAAGVSSAGHYEGWTDAEKAEHAQRPVEAVPACSQPERMVTHYVTSADYRAGADAYDDSQSHPLRLLAYIIHPVGYSLEWLVTRPFHEFVAQPDLEPVFGHGPHGYYGGSPIGAAEAMNLRQEYGTR